MTPIFRKPVRRGRNGAYYVHLTEDEQALLRHVTDELLEVLDNDEDPGVQRLYPPAHKGDPIVDAEFHLRRHPELTAGRRAAISTFQETIGAETLDEEQLQIWLSVVNDIRLVLGTHLDVTEDMDEIVPSDPRAPGFAVYGYLSSLLSDLIDAAEGNLPG